MRITALVLTVLSLSLLSFNSPSLKDPWKFIADKTVGFGVDHDVIHFGNLQDDFRMLKLRVTDGPIKMLDMKVYFDNGDVQDVAIRSLINKGGQSRVIQLSGGLRHLKKIEFWYETAGFANGRARVAVWGKR